MDDLVDFWIDVINIDLKHYIGHVLIMPDEYAGQLLLRTLYKMRRPATNGNFMSTENGPCQDKFNV